MRKLAILSLLLLMGVAQTIAQVRTVTGKVTDDKGNPLGGVTVNAVGRDLSTVTNNDGN
jgi:hypothetical protein